MLMNPQINEKCYITQLFHSFQRDLVKSPHCLTQGTTTKKTTTSPPPSSPTIYTDTLNVFLEDISGKRVLLQVIALHESLRIKNVILKATSWVFKRKIEKLFQVPG